MRSTRISPSSPVSSVPAVSMKITGPNGKNSMGFSTGSVVVPGISLTKATSWPAIALSRLDLPAFLRPSTAIRTLIPRGADSMSGVCVVSLFLSAMF